MSDQTGPCWQGCFVGRAGPVGRVAPDPSFTTSKQSTHWYESSLPSPTMATRGFIAHRLRGRYYVTYNLSDSSPTGLGKDLISEIPVDPVQFQGNYHPCPQAPSPPNSLSRPHADAEQNGNSPKLTSFELRKPGFSSSLGKAHIVRPGTNPTGATSRCHLAAAPSEVWLWSGSTSRTWTRMSSMSPAVTTRRALIQSGVTQGTSVSTTSRAGFSTRDRLKARPVAHLIQSCRLPCLPSTAPTTCAKFRNRTQSSSSYIRVSRRRPHHHFPSHKLRGHPPGTGCNSNSSTTLWNTSYSPSTDSVHLAKAPASPSANLPTLCYPSPPATA